MPDGRTSAKNQQVEAEGQTPETETLAQLQELAEGGNLAAQNDLGWMYQNGRGVPQDDKEQLGGIEKLPNKVMP